MRKYKLNKGILIALEGIDGAGKTTQTINLRNYFQSKGFNVVNFKEPTDGIYGQKIRQLAIHGRHTITPEKELELFIKDRIEDCTNNIRPSLEKKKLIFMDRYYFSNIAYQGALGLNINDILQRNEEIAVIPDLVIILDVVVKIGLSRIKQNRQEDHNHFEGEEYLEKVGNIFKGMKAPFVQIIDGSRDEDTVFKNVRNITQDIIAPYVSLDKRQVDLFGINIEDNKIDFSIN